MNWKKTIKILGILAVSGLIIGGASVWYIFNMPERNIEKEEPSYTLLATELLDEFSTNEDSSYIKYGDKVIQVTGSIVDIYNSDGEVTLMLEDEMSGVSCALDSMAVVKAKDKVNALTVGENITLKGRLDGYDMIMGVVLTRCYLILKEE